MPRVFPKRTSFHRLESKPVKVAVSRRAPAVRIAIVRRRSPTPPPRGVGATPGVRAPRFVEKRIDVVIEAPALVAGIEREAEVACSLDGHGPAGWSRRRRVVVTREIALMVAPSADGDARPIGQQRWEGAPSRYPRPGGPAGGVRVRVVEDLTGVVVGAGLRVAELGDDDGIRGGQRAPVDVPEPRAPLRPGAAVGVRRVRDVVPDHR